MDTLTISLSDSLKQFVEEQIATGAYSSVSEYVIRLIKKDLERKERESIDQKLLEAIESGPAEPFGPNEIEEIKAEVRAQSRQRKSHRTNG